MDLMDDIFIHPTSLVETQQIGRGTRIWAFTHVVKGARIGRWCNIGDHCVIEVGVKIADNVVIRHGNKIWEGVTLDNGGFVGPSKLSTKATQPQPRCLTPTQINYNARQWLVTTRIHEGATIGAGAMIIAGAVIGEFSVVSAGAVVVSNVPPYALVAGNPAHIQGWVCQCGQLLKFHNQFARCLACNVSYTKSNHRVKVATF